MTVGGGGGWVRLPFAPQMEGLPVWKLMGYDL